MCNQSIHTRRVAGRLCLLVGLSTIGSLASSISQGDPALAATTQRSSPWQVNHLPAELGQVAPLETNTNKAVWQPLNLGTSASTFAIGPSGEEYMANSAGIWQWKSRHWNYIPGTMSLGLASNGYANSPMTVNAQGDLIIFVQNQIWQLHNGRHVVISDGHEPNVSFLTWMPNGTLVAGLNVYPAPKNSSNYGLGGPAPIPALKLMAYSDHQWKLISLNLPSNLRGVRSAAWSSTTNQVALAFNNPQVLLSSPKGWQTLSLPDNLAHPLYVACVTWSGRTLLAGTTSGIWKFQSGHWSKVSVTAMPNNAEVTQLITSGIRKIAVTQNPDNSTSVFDCRVGVWKRQPLSMTEVNYIGQSPSGSPVLETQNPANFRQLYQYTCGVWRTISMKGFPSEAFVGNMPQPFYWPTSLTWSPSGVLTISSLYNGIWQRLRGVWQNVGGSVVEPGPYVSGSIGWLPNGDLVVVIRRDVPPLPKTPSFQLDSVYVYREGHWDSLHNPTGLRPNLFRFFAMGPHGEVIMQQLKGNRSILWTWQGGPWRESSYDATSLGDYQIGGISYDSKGSPILDISGYGTSDKNGVYQVTDGRLVQILKDPAPLRVKNTYWFHHIKLPDGALLFILMNQSGYHLWKYRAGRWTNMGLDGQDVVEMGILPENMLYAITQEGVCWVRTVN